LQWSLQFCACFIEQSAVSSASQSTTLASRPRSEIKLCITSARVARHQHGIELADEVAEDGGTVAGLLIDQSDGDPQIMNRSPGKISSVPSGFSSNNRKKNL
jgi:hypothetical protein